MRVFDSNNSNYDKYPKTIIKQHDDFYVGYEEIINKINSFDAKIICVETYPGVDDEELISKLVSQVKFDNVIYSKDIFPDEEELTNKMYPYLTDDRVRGVMFDGTIQDFVDSYRLHKARELIEQ